jgi:hypothetical protein
MEREVEIGKNVHHAEYLHSPLLGLGYFYGLRGNGRKLNYIPHHIMPILGLLKKVVRG